MERIRALIVEDSMTVRRRLADALGADPGIEVVGEAADGREGIELALRLRPDVITADMMMPHVSGLGLTEYIMAHQPTPILIVSSSTNRAELFKMYEALAAGAVDVLEKPAGDEPEGEWESRLISAVKLISRIKVITHPRGRMKERGSPLTAPVNGTMRRTPDAPFGLVVIGASTGGPAALVELFQAMPRGFPLPILVVMHLGEAFAGAFVDWLDGTVPQSVTYAVEGEKLEDAAGRVIMARPGRHLTVRGGRLRLDDGPERNFCRPSVDVLFESVARECGAETAACLLTGMGRDGAAGLLQIRQRGGLTIAQDEASSVVYGMPREAALMGAAERILPLPAIAPALAALGHARAEAKP